MTQIFDIVWIRNLLVNGNYEVDNSFGISLRIANQLRMKLGWQVSSTDPYSSGLCNQTINEAVAIEHINELNDADAENMLKKIIEFLINKIYNINENIDPDSLFRITKALTKYLDHDMVSITPPPPPIQNNDIIDYETISRY